MNNFDAPFKWRRLEGVEITADYDMPVVKPVNNACPRNLVSFNNAKYCKNKEESWYHFYIHHIHFERFWNHPDNYLLQQQGKTVIPNVGWSDETSYDWAFSGIPNNSILSITTQGCLKNRVCKQSLFNGLHELIRRKSPVKIIIYGIFHEDWKDKFGTQFEVLPSYSKEKWGKNGTR